MGKVIEFPSISKQSWYYFEKALDDVLREAGMPVEAQQSIMKTMHNAFQEYHEIASGMNQISLPEGLTEAQVQHVERELQHLGRTLSTRLKKIVDQALLDKLDAQITKHASVE